MAMSHPCHRCRCQVMPYKPGPRCRLPHHHFTVCVLVEVPVIPSPTGYLLMHSMHRGTWCCITGSKDNAPRPQTQVPTRKAERPGFSSPMQVLPVGGCTGQVPASLLQEPAGLVIHQQTESTVKTHRAASGLLHRYRSGSLHCSLRQASGNSACTLSPPTQPDPRS